MSEPTRPDPAHGQAGPTVPDAIGPFGRRPRMDDARSYGAGSDLTRLDSPRGARHDGGVLEGGVLEDGFAESWREPRLAPVLRRAGARLIDTGLLAVAGFAVIMPILVAGVGLDRPGNTANDPNASGAWSGPAVLGWIVVLAVLPFLYEAVQLALWGQTVGKRVLGLCVVAAEPLGQALTTRQAVSRAAVSNVVYLFGCGVGTVLAYLWAIWDQPLHQSVHDKVAGTVVVDDRLEYEEA